MPIKIIEADVKKDMGLFLNLLNENRSNPVDRRRFEWLYSGNPQGKARAWIVFDEKSMTPVAFTSVLPRMVKAFDSDVLCWNCCDFSVNKKFRTLGVAIKLRRAAKAGVDNGEIAALYAHPNDRMKLIHEKVGHKKLGEMHRYAKVLRANRIILEKSGSRFISALLSPFANFLLYCHDRLSGIPDRYPIEILENKHFGPEYDDLFKTASRHYNIIGERGAAYLNWRYADNPLYRTERIEIRQTGNLSGYIIFYIQDRVVVIKDMLLVAPEVQTLRWLIAGLSRSAVKRGAESLTAILMDTNPMIPFLKKAGFRLRPDTSSVYAYAGDSSDLKAEWSKGSNWYMTVGDRDV